MANIIIGIFSCVLGIAATVLFFFLSSKKPCIIVRLKKAFEINLDEKGVTQNSRIIVNNKDTRELVGYTLSFYLKSFRDFEHTDDYKKHPKICFENFEILSVVSNSRTANAEVALPRKNNNTVIGLCIRKLRGHFLAEYTISGYRPDTTSKVVSKYEDEFIKDYTIRFSCEGNK